MKLQLKLLAFLLVVFGCSSRNQEARNARDNGGSRTGCFLFNNQLLKVTYLTREEDAFIGDDVYVPLKWMANCSEDSEIGLARSSERTRVWPNKRVPYQLPADFPESYRTELADAIAAWAQSGINWVPKTNSDRDHVNFIVDLNNGEACGSSYLGRIGFEQPLRLRKPDQLAGCNMKRTIPHEMGHAMGFIHEHQRSDRDGYITFGSLDTSTNHNISKITGSINDSDFDLQSIMMYSTAHYADLKTIDNKYIPLTNTLSSLDVSGARRAYSQPTLASITAKTMNEDESLRLRLYPDDPDSQLSCSSNHFTAAVANSTLFSAITFDGNWPECYVNILAAPNIVGTTDVTIALSDSEYQTARNFSVTINAVNDKPKLASISKQIFRTNSERKVFFLAEDVDNALSCSSTHLAYSSSNTQLIPSSGGIVWSGASPNCSATIRPSRDQIGLATITISLSDGSLSEQKSFEIDISNNAPALPALPEQITISNVGKKINLVADYPNKTMPCSSTTFKSSSENNNIVADENSVVWSGNWPNCTATITPVKDAVGTTTLTFTLIDGEASDDTSFDFTVNPNPGPVVLSDIQAQATFMNTPRTVVFNIDFPGAHLACSKEHLSYQSTNPALVDSKDAIAWNGTWPTCSATINPVIGATGSLEMTIIAFDEFRSGEKAFLMSFLAPKPTPTPNPPSANTEDNTKITRSGFGLLPEIKVLAGRFIELPINAEQAPRDVDCSGLLSAAFENSKMLNESQFTLTGRTPSCRLQLRPAANFEGQSRGIIVLKTNSMLISEDFLLIIKPIVAKIDSNRLRAKAPFWFSFSSAESESIEGEKIIFRSWDFGDETSGNSIHFSKLYTIPGQYSVILKVKSENGITDESRILLTID